MCNSSRKNFWELHFHDPTPWEMFFCATYEKTKIASQKEIGLTVGGRIVNKNASQINVSFQLLVKKAVKKTQLTPSFFLFHSTPEVMLVSIT